ncbi:MAG: transglutaminase family protein [Deinococcales bacterium]
MIETNFKITHLNRYEYSDGVSLAYNEVKLTPKDFSHPLLEQSCLSHELLISPKPQDQRQRQDFFGNQVSYFNISSHYQKMSVTSNSVVKRKLKVKSSEVKNYLHTRLAPLSWQTARQNPPEFSPFHLASSFVPLLSELKAYAQISFDKQPLAFNALNDLMQRIHHDFRFKPGATHINTPLSEIAKTMTGVCQDYSHFMISCVRSMGLACRYVSGYLETLPPPGQPKLQGVDASHAWVSVYLPSFGWLDFDPTNNLIPLDQHITIAWGRDYADVSPLKGVIYGGGSHKLHVAVDMERKKA